jgi:type II secretory pathway pseudopilin PulG
MKMRRKVRGITLIGFVIVLCVLGFFAYLAMRLIPMYVEYFGVVKAMEQVRSEGNSSQKSIEEIRRDLSLKFDTQYVDDNSVPPAAIQLVRQGGASTLRIAYEKRVPFLYNLDIVGKFDKSVSLNGAGGE